MDSTERNYCSLSTSTDEISTTNTHRPARIRIPPDSIRLRQYSRWRNLQGIARPDTISRRQAPLRLSVRSKGTLDGRSAWTRLQCYQCVYIAPSRSTRKLIGRVVSSSTPHASSTTLDGSHTPVQGHEFPFDPLVRKMVSTLACRTSSRTSSEWDRVGRMVGTSRGRDSRGGKCEVGKFRRSRRRSLLCRD